MKTRRASFEGYGFSLVFAALFAAFSFALVAPGASQTADEAPGSEVVSEDAPEAAPAPEDTRSPLAGIWENRDRFVEFTADGRMRIVLKPYYGFVYQDTGYISCDIAYPTPSRERALVTPRYAGEKNLSSLPVLVLADSFYLSFLSREDPVPPADATASEATPTDATAAEATSTDGLWLASGAGLPILLYKPEPTDDLFGWVFRGRAYWKIRYWKTDARFRDKKAAYAVPGGPDLSVPKFLTVGGELYTCVTGTGTKLRNIESGTFSVADGKLSFKPDRPVYAGTEARYRDAVPFRLSPDGRSLSLGEPWLARSGVADLDAAIAEHNAKRRPARKPIFEFMELDFHWDEIERIRRNGL